MVLGFSEHFQYAVGNDDRDPVYEYDDAGFRVWLWLHMQWMTDVMGQVRLYHANATIPGTMNYFIIAVIFLGQKMSEDQS